MPTNPNKLSQFWQELKRRRVVRVITVYAAATFVILELVSIIEEPLQLPDWTLAFVIVLLCIGFIITVIFSWIYDITPEGIEKTKPIKEIKEKVPEKPSGVNAWKIATIISVIIIVGLIIFHTVGERKQAEDSKILDKSIAVLPFKYLSDEPDKQYLADGTMDAILLHLSKIKDLRVMARTSVEQYRETYKTASTICQELDVAYVLEGSFQKYGDQARLIVQLIEPGKEGHVWANEYDRNWKDIFSVQSEVAQAIAGELWAVITPQEKQLIGKIPTTDLTAYDFYQRGKLEHYKFHFERDTAALSRAEALYFKALEYDSTFADVYVGLAGIHGSKRYWLPSVPEDYYDTCFHLLDIALSYDSQLSIAYVHRGIFYLNTGKPEQAIEEFDKALKYNPNDHLAFAQKAIYSANYSYDFVEAIQNTQKAAELDRAPHYKPAYLRGIARSLFWAGYPEQARLYLQEALILDGDSAVFYNDLASSEQCRGNYLEADELWKKAYAIDSNANKYLRDLGRNHLFLGQNEEALEYFNKYLERSEASEKLIDMQYIGYAYWQNGYREKAEYYFNEFVNYSYSLIESGHVITVYNYTNRFLSGFYAFKGEKEKAYEYLRIATEKQRMPIWMVNELKNDPLFDSIRDEPEFQQIVKDVEAKYQAEHERVREWLEENDML